MGYHLYWIILTIRESNYTQKLRTFRWICHLNRICIPSHLYLGQFLKFDRWISPWQVKNEFQAFIFIILCSCMRFEIAGVHCAAYWRRVCEYRADDRLVCQQFVCGRERGLSTDQWLQCRHASGGLPPDITNVSPQKKLWFRDKSLLLWYIIL